MGHKMAILVDGGFRLKHAKNLRGEKTAEARASELVKYCGAHTRKENAELYGSSTTIVNPLDKYARASMLRLPPQLA